MSGERHVLHVPALAHMFDRLQDGSQGHPVYLELLFNSSTASHLSGHCHRYTTYGRRLSASPYIQYHYRIALHPSLLVYVSKMATAKETSSKDNADVIKEKETRTSQEFDLEKAGLRPDLVRTVSEPPWSVFSKRMKIWIIFLVSISALISPFGASMFLPALNVLSDVLDITPTQVNISITTYMVCLAILFPLGWHRLEALRVQERPVHHR